LNNPPTKTTTGEGGGGLRSPCSVRVADVLCMVELWGVAVYYRSVLEGVAVFFSVCGHGNDSRYREVEV